MRQYGPAQASDEAGYTEHHKSDGKDPLAEREHYLRGKLRHHRALAALNAEDVEAKLKNKEMVQEIENELASMSAVQSRERRQGE